METETLTPEEQLDLYNQGVEAAMKVVDNYFMWTIAIGNPQATRKSILQEMSLVKQGKDVGKYYGHTKLDN